MLQADPSALELLAVPRVMDDALHNYEMPRLSFRIPKLVVALLTRDATTISLDLLARVSVLEGIAGVNPDTWMRNVVPEREIVGVFAPKVKASSSSPRDSGSTTTADDILPPAIVAAG